MPENLAAAFARVPAYAQFGAANMPNYRIDAASGSRVNPPNRDYYRPNATDGYARAECHAARVPVRLANGRTVMRLRHICP